MKVFEKIFQALVGKCREYQLVEIDSTFCKVHQHVAGARNLSGGQIHDSECALTLLEVLNIENKSISGDKAYTDNKIHTFISEHNAKVCIPDKSNSVVTHDFDKELYKSRNIIERFFNRIKHYRHIATARGCAKKSL